jgi:hypothetical protein
VSHSDDAGKLDVGVVDERTVVADQVHPPAAPCSPRRAASRRRAPGTAVAARGIDPLVHLPFLPISWRKLHGRMLAIERSRSLAPASRSPTRTFGDGSKGSGAA